MPVARQLAEGEYYHILNRGAHRDPIGKDRRDWERLMFAILFFQSDLGIDNVGRVVEKYSPLTGYPVAESTIEGILSRRNVELTCFALMPNHFHLLIKERTEGGISRYLHRIETAYTKYFNARYEHPGHLFQGRYKAVHVKDNRQLLYLSAYIHRNPREIKGWAGREAEYPWSSLQDYVTANRWGGLLSTDIIASQFDATKSSNYADFVRTSTAKLLKKELPAESFDVTL
jgi:putative transposase